MSEPLKTSTKHKVQIGGAHTIEAWQEYGSVKIQVSNSDIPEEVIVKFPNTKQGRSDAGVFLEGYIACCKRVPGLYKEIIQSLIEKTK